MNTYKFLLKDYKAIKEANIELNGITVLAGENSAGKSTITRWLYYLVEVITNYDKFVYDDLRNDILNILHEYRIGFRGMRYENNATILPISKWQTQSINVDYTSEQGVLRIIEEAKEIIVRIAEFIDNINQGEDPLLDTYLSRALMYLGIDGLDNFDRNSFISKNISKIENVYNNYCTRIKERSKENIFNYVRQHYEETLKRPNYIKFIEDKVPILDESIVGYLLGIQRAIYVDTPMAIVNKSSNNSLWWKLSELLEKPRNEGLSLVTKKMSIRIQRLIHGTIKVNDNEFDDSLRYVREDNLDISLGETATGIKSFACIIRLLENGYLDKNTLLIIDEPEVHLHPQWIVEYARILVLLSKELGVRVLIASHNPDMVAAIQSIGEKEGLKEKITFYQAIQTDTKYQYEYKNLGFEVAEIFKSFNIALSRIKDYGRIDN